MRSLTYFVAVSLDGYIAGPDGDLSAFPVGDHVQWQSRTYPETIPAVHWGALGVTGVRSPTFDTVVMGRATYDIALSEGIEDPYPHLEQVVFSRSLAGRSLPVTVVEGSAVDHVQELKRRPGAGIWLCGGGVLAAQLADEIDRLVLKVCPLTLGTGIRLFEGATPTSGRDATWRPVDQRLFGSGVIVLTYERADGRRDTP